MALSNVNHTHWTSDTPIEPGWYWYREQSYRAIMLRIDDHGFVDSPREFDGIQSNDLVGDWWAAQIKAPD